MNECKISIEAPKILLKGAGFPNTSFLPAWIYNIKITLKNPSNDPRLCSFSLTLGNGIRYIKNLQTFGPDSKIIFDLIKVVEPSQAVGNNNVIIYANNFMLSGNSENVLSFDICLCDKYTKNSIENSGDKISHKSKIYFYGHLINEENVDSCNFSSIASDYEIKLNCEDDKISSGDVTKFYIDCRTGQYDMVRSIYVRSILDEGLEFIADSSNMEPKNVYAFDKKTILKWNVGSLQPCEVKKIGYKVKLNEANFKEGLIKKGETLKNKVNSNCINNSTYTQCPANCEFDILIE